jgi:signal transduction histidine kinase
MRRFFALLGRPTTYSRWLHLLIPAAVASVWLFISPSKPWMPFIFAIPVGLLPVMRLGEGVQAQLLLTPEQRSRPDAAISVGPATTWADRWRTVVWLEVRLVLAAVVCFATVWLPGTAVDLVRGAFGTHPSDVWLARDVGPGWWCALLAPMPILMLLGLVIACGEAATAAARGLLGPSPAERMTALEERTEQLLERNRIARELHDSIGHALTVAVVQAGAARTAGNPEFTARALAAIEETGRNALDDLERVLRVLLESARGSGVKLEVEMTGPLELVPGPVSREGYRILQESLTNVLRHAGAVPVRVRILVVEERLELEVANPLAGSRRGTGGGSGLRGMRERAALLGGKARTGPHEGEWRVHASLPLDGIR